MSGGSSSSMIDNAGNMPIGTETELIRIRGAQLYLVDGTESVRMGSGDFSLIMMVQANTMLATLVGQVNEFQWPVAKDAPVLKIANLRYAFSIPMMLLYGLILPDNTTQDQVQKLESALRQYCTYEIRPEIARAAGVSDLRLWSTPGLSKDGESEGARYWTSVADDVEGYSGKLVRQMESGSKAAAEGILRSGEWVTWGVKQGGSYVKSIAGPPADVVMGNGDEMSPRMRKRVDQARRMSAVAKLLSQTVLRGVIGATGNVANILGTAIGGARPVRAVMSSGARRDVVVASVNAFAQIVEAIETAGKSLATTTGSVGTDIVQLKFGEEVGQVAQEGMGAMGNMLNSMWTLNKVGLFVLWRATTTSVFNYSSRGGGEGGGTSRSPTGMSSSPGTPPNSAGSLQRPSPSSSGRTLSLSTSLAMAQDHVPHTAQFFPNSPDHSRKQSNDHPQQQFYAVPPPSMQAHHPQMASSGVPTYPGYSHTSQSSSSSFRPFTRSGIPPAVQSFFPNASTESSKRRRPQ